MLETQDLQSRWARIGEDESTGESTLYEERAFEMLNSPTEMSPRQKKMLARTVENEKMFYPMDTSSLSTVEGRIRQRVLHSSIR